MTKANNESSARIAMSTNPSRSRSGVRAATLTIALAAVGILFGAPSAQATEQAAPPTCQGEGIERGARIRAEADTVIHAPLSTIWNLQTDVERWPSWQPGVLTSKRLDSGPLKSQSAFRWTTPAPATATTAATIVEVTSTVQKIQSNTCILWNGPAVGTGVRIDKGTHLWTFTEVKGGVHVHTEETFSGAQVEREATAVTGILRAGLQMWLRDLKAAAEKTTEKAAAEKAAEARR
ncbi:SRPBCC family protein [Pendulispora albinea]|uniref:SRPBCC family protein n=1 Tax=Pendulispora albinea TaxID=2741071 RepID=A0ABZ2LVD4_9BACT